LRAELVGLGELEAGNYTHYELRGRGPFRVVLSSLEGDCDLYASDSTPRVDFSNYDLQSVTCGDDEIYVDKSFKRPLYVSVYAHPNYLTCKYSLSVYRVAVEDEPSQASYADNYEAGERKEESRGTKEDEHADGNENESFFTSLLINLIEIIVEVLL
jgi:hypothetical protein